MGKRSDFQRVERDFYVTPKPAVLPLIPMLPHRDFGFCEPCAGNGALIEHLEELSSGWCKSAYDIKPEAKDVRYKDARELTEEDLNGAEYIITNPPWDRTKASGYLLHSLIERFVTLAPSWLLFDADWMHTRQAKPYIDQYLMCVISVGRVKWIEDSDMTGKDNCAWYGFRKNARTLIPTPSFVGRDIIPRIINPEFPMGPTGQMLYV